MRRFSAAAAALFPLLRMIHSSVSKYPGSLMQLSSGRCCLEANPEASRPLNPSRLHSHSRPLSHSRLSGAAAALFRMHYLMDSSILRQL